MSLICVGQLLSHQLYLFCEIEYFFLIRTSLHTEVSIWGGAMSLLYKTGDDWEKKLLINYIFSQTINNIFYVKLS